MIFMIISCPKLSYHNAVNFCRTIHSVYITVILDTHAQRLSALAKPMRRHMECMKWKEQNRKFHSNKRRFYNHIRNARADYSERLQEIGEITHLLTHRTLGRSCSALQRRGVINRRRGAWRWTRKYDCHVGNRSGQPPTSTGVFRTEVA